MINIMTKSNLSRGRFIPPSSTIIPRGKPEPPIIRYVAAISNNGQIKFRLTEMNLEANGDGISCFSHHSDERLSTSESARRLLLWKGKTEWLQSDRRMCPEILK